MICFFTSFLTWKNNGFEERSNKQNMQKTTKTHKKRFLSTFCTCTNDTFGSSTAFNKDTETQEACNKSAREKNGKKIVSIIFRRLPRLD